MRERILKLLDHTVFRAGTNAYTECEQAWCVDKLHVEDYDLWYVRKGHGFLTVSGYDYELRQGALYLFRPGDTVSAWQDQNDRLSVYYCHFLPSASPLFSHLVLPQYSEPESGVVEEAFRAFFEDAADEGSASSFNTRLLLFTIFRIWLRMGELTLRAPGEASLKIDGFLRAMDYLRLHLLERPSLDQLADICRMEKSGVNKLFNTYAGKSPLQVHAQMRMEYAATLLDLGLMVKEIAALLGYSDSFAFSKAFKRQQGVSPALYASRA